MAVIFGASSLRGSQVPGGFSTPAHFVEYAVLGTLAYAALRVDLSVSRSAVLAVAISSAYAVTDELHQMFVPGRIPDIADWAVDTAGALTAVACILLVVRFRRKQR
jgi:VanZ family protein